MSATPSKHSFGMIGLGTMGRNLLLNLADHGFSVAGYDKDASKVALLATEGAGKPAAGFADLASFLGSLQTPRTVMMLVPAGPIVDSVVAELEPLLAPGDIIIDGGNSHFTDTERRAKAVEAAGFHFFGMGVSGGEEGARFGPSMMPGGDKEAYSVVQPMFEAIAAQVDGEPCVTYIGPGAAGHFVKMVHNGIEYGLMQLIAETYAVLKTGLGLDNGGHRPDIYPMERGSVTVVSAGYYEGHFRLYRAEYRPFAARRYQGRGPLEGHGQMDVAGSHGFGAANSDHRHGRGHARFVEIQSPA